MKVGVVHLCGVVSCTPVSPVLIRWKAPTGYLPDPDRAKRPKSYEHPELWFAREFLWKGTTKYRAFAAWTIDLDALNDTAIAAAEADDTVGNPAIYAGVIVRHRPSQGIWVLTGETDDDGMFQGVWPD